MNVNGFIQHTLVKKSPITPPMLQELSTHPAANELPSRPPPAPSSLTRKPSPPPALSPRNPLFPRQHPPVSPGNPPVSEARFEAAVLEKRSGDAAPDNPVVCILMDDVALSCMLTFGGGSIKFVEPNTSEMRSGGCWLDDNPSLGPPADDANTSRS